MKAGRLLRFLLLAMIVVGTGAYFTTHHHTASVTDSGALHQATGEISGVYPSEKSITIRHDPISTLNMGAMTMPFDVEDARLLDGLAPKQRVEFQVKQVGRR